MTRPARNLRKARVAKGYTQTALAMALGVTQSTISKVERSNWRHLSAEKWDDCAKLLGVPAYRLIGEVRVQKRRFYTEKSTLTF